MGCCGSKEDDGIVSQTADVATAAGGAVVGAAGAVVGGTVAVARGGVALVPGGRVLLEHVDDATGAFADATVKTGELVAEATKKVASQADFMKIISSPEVQAKLPKIGVLRCARAKFMPAQLSVGSNSYLYTTVQAEVQGLPYADVRAGKPLDAAQTKALKVMGRHRHRHIHHLLLHLELTSFTTLSCRRRLTSWTSSASSRSPATAAPSSTTRSRRGR